MTTAADLTKAIDRVKAAQPHLRLTFIRSATAVAAELANERTLLVDRLERRWSWCAANAGHPALAQREDAAIADLRTYEAMEDALREAASVLFGDAA